MPEIVRLQGGWTCRDCGASGPLGTPHYCPLAAANDPLAAALHRIAAVLERFADWLES